MNFLVGGDAEDKARYAQDIILLIVNAITAIWSGFGLGYTIYNFRCKNLTLLVLCGSLLANSILIIFFSLRLSVRGHGEL